MDYISKEAAISIFNAKADMALGTPKLCFSAAAKMIEALPAADVREVRHGEWELGEVSPGYFTPGGNRPWLCSECGYLASYMLAKPIYSFCPTCGADMRGGKDNA